MKWKLLTITLVLAFALSTAVLAPLLSQTTSFEGLQELSARKVRYASAKWGPQFLEDPSQNYSWQPETVCYRDQETGAEVWILTHAPDKAEYFSKEHGTNAWSYDGSRIGFFSTTRESGNPRIVSDYRYRWIVNTDGSGLRVCEGYGRRNIPFEGFGWAHTENAYYSFGSGAGDASDSKSYRLYKNALRADNTIGGSVLVDTSAVNAYAKDVVKEGISQDDNWIVARDLTTHDAGPSCVIPTTEMYFISLKGTPTVSYHWGIARGIGPSVDPYGDHTTKNEDHWHDVWAPGPNTKWIMWQYSGSSLFVTLDRSGSASDGGPKWTDWNGSSFGEIRVESSGAGTPPNPYKMPYFGHPTFDRWGRYALLGTYSDPQSQAGTRIWDSVTHSLLANYMMKGRYDGQHHSWSGWTDHVIMVDPSVDHIYGNYLSGNESTRYPIVNLHYPGYSGNYNGYPRPSQSPDGTKVAFHAVWLNNGGDDFPCISWAVVYYPYPPEELHGVKSGVGVLISWSPPKYTTRGWPLDTDPAPSAREIKGYHIWRSISPSGPWTELSTAAVQGTSYLDTGVPPGSKLYYAVTSEEFSRLESRELSEILECTILRDGNVQTRVAAPRGLRDFWTMQPSNPTNLVIKPQSIPGHFSLSWTEPSQKSKVRYYNIYYSNAGPPPVSQSSRIASVPVGTTSYLDWLADPSKPANYVITSVDRCGNEGGRVAPRAPTGLRIN